MQVDSFNPKHCTRWIQVQMEYWKEHLVVSTLPYSSLEPYLRVLPSIIVLGYKFCYPWIPRAVLEELSSQRRNKKLLKVGMAQKRVDVLQRFRNKGARKRRERGRTRYAVHTVNERQATLQWKSTRERGAETPEERETRNGSSAVRHFQRGNEDVTE